MIENKVDRQEKINNIMWEYTRRCMQLSNNNLGPTFVITLYTHHDKQAHIAVWFIYKTHTHTHTHTGIKTWEKICQSAVHLCFLRWNLHIMLLLVLLPPDDITLTWWCIFTIILQLEILNAPSILLYWTSRREKYSLAAHHTKPIHD